MWGRAALLGLGMLAATAGTGAAQSAQEARYVEPTDRYGHDALGPGHEWEALEVTVAGGAEALRFEAGPEHVFEDIAPRLWDVDGDGQTEIVTVQSHLERGARLLILKPTASGLTPLSASPYIGARHRWLAPVGMADIDADGVQDLILVDRPHLAKELVFYAFAPGALREMARVPGYTNHRFGEDRIIGGIRDCGTGPEAIVASGDWRERVAFGFDSRAGALYRQVIGPGTASEDFARALSCR